MIVRRSVNGVLGVALLATAGVMWAWPETGDESDARSAARTVETVAVSAAPMTRTVRFAGVTRAARRARLSFLAPGRLAERRVEAGSSVGSGELLARLDDRGARNALAASAASLAEAEVRLAQAVRDRDRVIRLVDVAAATAEEREAVSAVAAATEAARDAARTQRSEAQRLLGETALRAPFAGTITAVLAEPGEWVSPGRPVLELVGTGGVELEVELPETMVGAVAAGDEVVVEAPLVGLHTVGRVRSAAEVAAGPGRFFTLVVALPADGELWAGVTAEVVLQTGDRRALVVPLAAVVNPGASRPTVFCVRDGKAVELAVELGEVVGDQVAVRGELEEGDRIVIAGHTRLATGDPVEVRR